MTRPAAVVFAQAPRPGECKKRLEPVLGADGCARLQSQLVSRAAAWAADVGDLYVLFTPGDAGDDIAPLVPEAATLVPQVSGPLGVRLAAAVRDVFAEHGGPVVVVGVDTPLLGRGHASSALDDLAAGIDVTLGPASDGGYYLIGLRAPCEAVFALPDDAWGGPQVMFLTMQAAVEAGLSIGMLRAERALHEHADARALLADPLAPPDVIAALSGLEHQ